MSQNAADINAEILDRLDRDDHFPKDLPGGTTSSKVYDYMNRVKKRVQTHGSPLDFMQHACMNLMGSGTGEPGDESTFSNADLLLPPNFVAPIEFWLLTDFVIEGTDLASVYGNGVPATPLFVYPSSCDQGQGRSTDTAGQDLYPLYSVAPPFIIEDLAARGITIDPSVAFNTWVEGYLLSREHYPFRRQAKKPNPGFNYDISSANGIAAKHIDARAAMSGVYAPGADEPWAGKTARIDTGDLSRLGVGEDQFVLAVAVYYRTLPDYNAPNFEWAKVGTSNLVVEDIFTRTAEDLLVFGTLALAHYLLDDDAKAQRYDQKFMELRTEFIRKHQMTQIVGARGLQQLRQGRRIASMNLGGT